MGVGGSFSRRDPAFIRAGPDRKTKECVLQRIGDVPWWPQWEACFEVHLVDVVGVVCCSKSDAEGMTFARVEGQLSQHRSLPFRRGGVAIVRGQPCRQFGRSSSSWSGPLMSFTGRSRTACGDAAGAGGVAVTLLASPGQWDVQPGHAERDEVIHLQGERILCTNKLR